MTTLVIAYVLLGILYLAFGIIILSGIFAITLTLIFGTISIVNYISHIKINLMVWDLDWAAKVQERALQASVGYLLIFQLAAIFLTESRLWIKYLPFDFAGIALALYWGYIWKNTK